MKSHRPLPETKKESAASRPRFFGSGRSSREKKEQAADPHRGVFFMEEATMGVFEKCGAWADRKLVGWGLARMGRRHPVRAGSSAAIAAMEGVRQEWEFGGPKEFPGLRVSGMAWALSCDGLAAFFEACRRDKSGREVGLPSVAADAVWHAWIRHDPAGLASFCAKAAGRALPHLPKGEMAGPMGAALARCWAASCRSEGLDPLGGVVPSLFALDASLGTPGGWSYRYDKKSGRVWVSRLGSNGRELPATAVASAALTAAGLLAAGAIGQGEFDRWMADPAHAEAARKAGQGDSGSGGGGCGSCSIGDAGCSSGGGDGGGCGGGCGGD
jgi:hypothetical protein